MNNQILLTILFTILLPKSFAQQQPQISVAQQQPQTSVAQDCCEEYCYGKDTEKLQHRHFSTLNQYEPVRGGSQYRINYNVLGCVPKKIWFLGRHDPRLPSDQTIKDFHDLIGLKDEIKQNYDQRKTKPDRGALCQGDKFSIVTWHFPNHRMNSTQRKFLTQSDREDIQQISQGLGSNLPNLPLNPYEPRKFLFRHIGSEHFKNTYKAFVNYLFKEAVADAIEPASESESILSPQIKCEKWNENVRKLEGAESELTKFQNSPTMQKTIKDISLRLGFLHSLSLKQIELMWDMCRYEQGWDAKLGTWCAAFTPAQVSVLEYAEDLKFYHKNGYGNSEVNSRVGCAAVKEMLIHLNNSVSMPQFIFNFADSDILQLFITAMGIKKDDVPLKADNINDKRQWKTSTLTPFAANLAAVSYTCEDELKVMFFLNEIPVNFEWCKVGLCRWGDVMINYEKFLHDDCNSICSSCSKMQISLNLIMLSSIYYLIFLKF